MTDEPKLMGYKLIKDATLVEFEVLKTDIQPTVGNDDKLVNMELQLEEDLVESCALGFIFALCVLSFHDGRPRGISGHWYEDEDELAVSDFLEHLRYRSGRLHVHLDYIRGRCLKTTVDLMPDGKLRLRTVNRGEAATRWVDYLRGENFLRPLN
jgi:hypothetical protein